MKKLITLLLTFACVLTLAACSQKEADNSSEVTKHELLWMKINDENMRNMDGYFEYDEETNKLTFGFENQEYSAYFRGNVVTLANENMKESESNFSFYNFNSEVYIEDGIEYDFVNEGYATIGLMSNEIQVMFRFSENELITLAFIK